MINLQELATRIHAQNRAAGWWDKPRPRVQTAWIIVTKLSEATEAERKGRYADLEAFYRANRTYLAYPNGPLYRAETFVKDCFKRAFENEVKDSFQDEIADATIRTLDLAASEDCADIAYEAPTPHNGNNEGAFFQICEMLGNRRTMKGGDSMAFNLLYCVQILHGIADHHGFDLWQHVELKLKYNQTRGKMHGGKKF